MNTFIQKKHLLAEIRNGDFTHPKDREAVHFATSKIDFASKQRVLDVGSGLGGTVDMLNQTVTTIGLDKDIQAIHYARNQYKDCKFLHGDVLDIDQLTDETFDLFTLFSSFYAFEDQNKACNALMGRAREKADLLVFEYCSKTPFKGNLFDDDHSPFNPIALDRLDTIFSPWSIVEIHDLSEMFFESYQSVLNTMREHKSPLCHHHGKEAFDRVYDSFTKLAVNLDTGVLGGCLVHAQT
ncbi:class I SAM-dependent methyltransferase [Vibrio tetraodonis]|uniref:class I SAM-dependent methyltransferase n=1 Tax=Vibrio tetraodonis TaxID=2231647 RepID=UPI0013B3AED1|nr:class I SAM-dependent methyltransferase [Vibrio tetraodonis]